MAIQYSHCSLHNNKSKQNFYRGKDSMKSVFANLKEHAIEIINWEKNEMLTLTNKQEKEYKKQILCPICKEEFNDILNEDENYRRVWGHCRYTWEYRAVGHSIYHLRSQAPKETPVMFHNGSNYEYHFTIKELVEKFECQFEFLKENTEKYKTFSAPIAKGTESGKTTYKIKFIDSVKFISS